MRARALILSLVLCASAAAQPQNSDWLRPFPPFNLIGNVYGLGIEPVLDKFLPFQRSRRGGTHFESSTLLGKVVVRMP